jgi:DNA-binding CsgD family transcriptional regulator
VSSPTGVVRQLLEPALVAKGDHRHELLVRAAALGAPLFDVDSQPRASEPLVLSPERSGAIVHGLYWLCANLAESAPVLLAVDDAHWADRASLRFLCYARARPRAPLRGHRARRARPHRAGRHRRPPAAPAALGPHALTPSERRVAEMAATGMPNREIAQALFVTQRTVEIRLTHSYQKLDIASREQLPDALAP